MCNPSQGFYKPQESDNEPPKMYRVRLTRTWSATLETLVWATSKGAAIQAAKDEEDLSSIDADDEGLDYSARKLDINFDEIKLLLEEDLDLEDEIIVADPMAHSQLMSFNEFMLQVDPEYLEWLRTQAIEKDNGQLDLLSQVQP
jgi:hypothetical protein